jgi:hypothetical protein
MKENKSWSNPTGTENTVHVAAKLLFSGGMTHSIAVRAAIGTDCI